MKRFVWCVAVGLALVTSGCEVVGGDALDTESAWARWQAAHLTDYEVEQRRVFVCNLCDGEDQEAFARVVVRDGAVAEVYDADGALIILAETSPDIPIEDYALTVEDIFEQIRLAEERLTDELAVEFDGALGYPRRFYVVSDNGEVREEILLRSLKPL